MCGLAVSNSAASSVNGQSLSEATALSHSAAESHECASENRSMPTDKELGFDKYDPALGSPTTTIPRDAAEPDPTFDERAESSADSRNVQKDRTPPAAEGRTDPGSAERPPCTQYHRTPAGDSAGDEMNAESFAASSCVGNCYQSDRAPMVGGIPNNAYNLDYWVYLGSPQTNESNICDGSGAGCFWYVSVQMNTDEPNTAMHHGPQRGNSASGNSGGVWKLDVSGYGYGNFQGGLSGLTVPMNKWVRVRTWRLDTVSYGGVWYGNFGVWAYWDGVDHYAASLTIPGRYITWMMPFVEVYESNNQCSTDFTRAWLDNFVYRNTSGGPFAVDHTTADYESNCSNTTWRRVVSSSDDYVLDERDTSRVISQGATLWNLP